MNNKRKTDEKKKEKIRKTRKNKKGYLGKKHQKEKQK